MLAAPRRLRHKNDFQSTVRSGQKASGAALVLYFKPTGEPVRFGFIVSGKIGNAVKRNRLKRQLRHIAAGITGTGDVVVRALPSATSTSGIELANQFTECFARLSK